MKLMIETNCKNHLSVHWSALSERSQSHLNNLATWSMPINWSILLRDLGPISSFFRT